MAVRSSPSLSSSCACVGGAGRSQLKREGKRNQKQKRAVSAYLNARKLTSLKKVRTQSVFKCCDRKTIVENYNNFRKSGIPDRIMCFQKGEWKDFSIEIVALLKQAFRSRTSGVEVVIGGLSYIVDFLRMWRIDLRNGGRTSIAWIDVNGKCFFPRVVCEEDGEGNEEQSSSSSPSLDVKIDLRIDARKRGLNVGREESCVESQNSSDKGNVQSSDKGNAQSIDKGNVQSGVSDDQNSECCTGRVQPSANESCLELCDNLIRLTQDDLECVAVQRKFYSALGALRMFTRVVGVHRNLHKNVSGQSRLHAFKRQERFEIMRKTELNANIRYAWHGTSKSGVSGIIMHGFGHPMTPKHGAAYGKGVYLAPEGCAYLSAAYSDVDENGEQHMVLCQVILGNCEQVMLGSQQYHPSSEEFDTGVDDLKNPKQYIVWSTHMNTHILPLYVVSFKVPPQLHEYWSSLKAKRGAGQAIPRRPLQDGQFACPRSISKMKKF
uniref:Poly [ADP-ribose] polymerase n=1 Tax=Araucaria cunninghamii TaxID=56994 RepID=A0A0D6R274_ARACU